MENDNSHVKGAGREVEFSNLIGYRVRLLVG